MAGTAPPQIPGCRDLSLIGERVARSLYAASSDKLGRAVTVIAYPPLAEGRTWDDFDRAAATAQRLGVHPSMISIHEWGHAGDGRPWIVTDPQPAEALDTVLKLDGPLEPERALQVGVLLAGALETAHGAGIVHGDLSPARLVLGSHGEPLMTETGLAPFAVFPGLGALNNPVRYHAPPEVLERTETTTATDVYSLASTVYALIAGRAPHEKPAEVTDSNASLLLRVLQLPVPAIERPGLPPWLLDALRAPLAPDPGKRPQQAIEVAWILQDAQRRAGFAVTEPVVLDLDDIENHRSRRATGGAMASSRTARGSWPAPLGAAGAWPDRPDVPAPVPDPDPPSLRQAATYSFPDTAPAPNGRSDLAEDPAPTIFPFAVPDAPEPLTGNGTSHWPPAPAGTAAPTNGATLWPSSWPSTDQPDELPAWAQPPADEPEAGSALWSPSTGAEPEPPPDATTDLTAPPDLPPWASPAPATDSPRWSATEPPAAPGEPATLPPWATPAPPADTESASGLASSALPPWATPEPPADARSPAPSALPPWATPEPPADARSPAPSALPPWATPEPPADARSPAPSALPPWATPEPPADARSPAPSALPPWATPEPAADTSPSAPTAGEPAGLPPWASPASADTPPWLATPEPAPAPTADLPPWAATPADTPPWAAAAEPAPPTDTPPWAAAAEPAPTADSPPWITPASAPTAGTPEPGPAADGRTGEAPDAPAADQSPWAAAPGAGTTGPPAELPAWWISSGPGSAPSDADAGASDPPGGGEPSAAPLPPANGNGSSTGYGVPRPPELDVLPAWYTDPLPLGSGNKRLPGGGDELRTLFGAVVGDPPPAPPPPAAPAAREAPADVDPLGPPTARPPLDLSRLQDPFGPAAPPTPIAIGAGTAAPVRTHPPAPAADETPPGGRVVTGRPPSPAAAAAAAAVRSARDGDSGTTDAAPGAPAAAGPPALPVLILVGVVAVLILGVAWLVITGDDAAQPASERPDAPAVADAPTGLAVTPVPEGAQLTWQGAADGTYVVTVLSTTEAPRDLPPAVGTTALVPIAGAPAGTERCFTVAVAPAANDGEPGTPSDAACTGSATPDQMLPAPGG